MLLLWIPVRYIVVLLSIIYQNKHADSVNMIQSKNNLNTIKVFNIVDTTFAFFIRILVQFYHN